MDLTLANSMRLRSEARRVYRASGLFGALLRSSGFFANPKADGGEAFSQALQSRRDDCRRAMGSAADESGLEPRVLGGGSNCLLPPLVDNPLALCDLTGFGMGPTVKGQTLVRVGAGEEWPAFVEQCARLGLRGVQFLADIPGAVGGAAVQNIGAYGQEAAKSIQTVYGIDLLTGETRALQRDECQFGYRDSVFKTKPMRSFLVLAVDFNLSRAAARAADYPGLGEERERLLEERNKAAALAPEGGAALLEQFRRLQSQSLDGALKAYESLAQELSGKPADEGADGPKGRDPRVLGREGEPCRNPLGCGEPWRFFERAYQSSGLFWAIVEESNESGKGPALDALAVSRLRARKLPDPRTLPNLGSYFKNIEMPLSDAKRLQIDAPDLPIFEISAKYSRPKAKIPAAYLLDRVGMKGRRCGGAVVNPLHPLVWLNAGGAGYEDFARLENDAKTAVKERFGVDLEREPVGDWN